MLWNVLCLTILKRVSARFWAHAVIMISVFWDAYLYCFGIQAQLLQGTFFKDLPSEVNTELLRDLSSGIVDRAYYALEYGSKEDARSVGLFEAFHDATLRHKERYSDIAQKENPDLSTERFLILRCKRLVQSRTAQLHKGHHVSMPAVMSYIRGMPICYSSHSFVSLQTDLAWRCVKDVLDRSSGAAASRNSQKAGTVPYPPQTNLPVRLKIMIGGQMS